MADKNNAADRQNLRVHTPPQQISKEMILENSIPLSPQWLLPKQGEGKSGGAITAEPPFSPSHAYRSDYGKTPGNNEFPDAEKRAFVTRSSYHDAEGGRQNRWREEERETNPAVRRDRWRDGDGDKDVVEPRRERQSENSPRFPGDVRRKTSERWNELPKRETGYDFRRENKWNSSWGPENKESDGWREKRVDSTKDVEVSRDVGNPPQLSQGKDEKEGESVPRPWRPSSFARGRGDSSFNAGKQGQPFGSWRGRGENGSSTFSAGRGKPSSIVGSPGASGSLSYYSALHDVSSGDYGDLNFRYSRTKLLDIYRVIDVESYRKLVESFVEVPSITQPELLEPLAMSSPSLDELAVLKSIDSGDIISGGPPRGTRDAASLRHDRAGTGEDLPFDDSKTEISEKSKYDRQYHLDLLHRKQMHIYEPDPEVQGLNLGLRHDEAWIPKGANQREDYVREQAVPSQFGHLSISARMESKDHELPHVSGDRCATFYGGNETSLPRGQISEVFDAERGMTRIFQHDDSAITTEKTLGRNFQPQPPLEELMLCYKDPQGDVQGPFSGADLIGWYENGYFGLDLQVRLADAPASAKFSSLGDVMPHLRMKARPPPGFAHQKQMENIDSPSVFPGLGTVEYNSGPRIYYEPKSSTEAENRFLETLMAGNVASQSTSLAPSPGYVSGLQEALLWSGTVPTSTESRNNLPLGHMSSTAISQASQHPEIQQTPPYFHNPCSIEIPRDSRDQQQPNSLFPLPAGYNIPSQRLQQTGQHPGNNGLGVPQDPNILSMLQQQYMLSQLQLQSHLSLPSQLSLLDKLILMERQKQEQKLLMQQQHLLAQMLSGHQSPRQPHLSEQHNVLHQAAVETNPSLNQMGLSQLLDAFRLNSQMGALDLQGGSDSSITNLPRDVSQNLATSLDRAIQPKQRTDMPGVVDSASMSEPLPSTSAMDDSLLYEERQRESSVNVAQPVAAVEQVQEVAAPELLEIKHAVADSSEPEITMQGGEEFKGDTESMSEEGPLNSSKTKEISLVKKSSEKKPKKQKNMKSLPSVVPSKPSSKTVHMSQPFNQDALVETNDLISDIVETTISEYQPDFSERMSRANEDDYIQPMQRAWKPAPVPKAKSLLEIQQEEQQRLQFEGATPEVVASSNPARWSGVVASSTDFKIGANAPPVSPGTTLQRKSQLHDLLALEVISTPIDDPAVTEPVQLFSEPKPEISAADEDDFVEAKDSKKSRKKAAKVKSVGTKNTGPIVSPDVTPSPAAKAKAGRQAQQEKEREVSSVVPVGPSLGDFVFWKGGHPGTATAPGQAAAWSTESLRAPKPASLREILKEEEKKGPSSSKQLPVAAPPRAQQARSSHAGTSPWLISGTSPSSKATSPGTSRSLGLLPKTKTEDDLFWGPLDQPKQEGKLSSIAAPAPSGIWGAKGAATPLKIPSALPSSVAAHSHSKGRRDAGSKHSEAADFRSWCESELFRLTGSRDTSFLEFCMKQSSSEALALLRENLGVLDRDDSFVDNLLNYKELLPADVVELAFRLPPGPALTKSAAPTPHQSKPADVVPTVEDADGGEAPADADGSSRGGGRKKGKKGKKVSAAVLGFNVVSNRIMMGEIQSVED